MEKGKYMFIDLQRCKDSSTTKASPRRGLSDNQRFVVAVIFLVLFVINVMGFLHATGRL